MVKAEDYNITASYLRSYLAGLRRVAGAQYPQLLEQAGLSRYASKYPPLGLHYVAKGINLVKIHQQAIKLLGPDLFRLFYRNLGREFARNVATNPVLQAAVAKVGPIKGQDQLLELMKVYVEDIATYIDSEIELQRDHASGGVYFTIKECLFCAQMGRQEVPICPGMAAYFKELIPLLTTKHCQVSEKRCGAITGERDCVYLVRLGY